MEKVLIILENPLVVAIITTGVNVLFNYLDKWILNYNIKTILLQKLKTLSK